MPGSPVTSNWSWFGPCRETASRGLGRQSEVWAGASDGTIASTAVITIRVVFIIRCVVRGNLRPNGEVSDGSQPPTTFGLAPSESAGSRSLDRFVVLLAGGLPR